MSTRYVSVVFSRPRGGFKPASWIIRLIERTPYSHVALIWDSPSLGVKAVYQASSHGVNFQSYFYFTQQNKVIHSFRLRLTEANYKAMLRMCINLAGKRYGFVQILGILLVRLFGFKKNPLSRGQTSFVCSELVLVFLDKICGWKSKLDPDTAGPKALFKLIKSRTRL